MAIGKCLKCDTVTEMTEDHVIPKWFLNLFATLQIKVPDSVGKKVEKELVCTKCNSNKGGKLDYSSEKVRVCANLKV